MQATQPPILVLWDDSHIWGLMVWRALRALGLPSRLVKGKDIANGGLLGKPCAGGQTAPLLMAPGGNARLKAQALGEAGREAVRDWLRAGGRYLGFCGGAGLALSHARAQDGLHICPWSRGSYPERQQHLISGHARVRVRSCLIDGTDAESRPAALDAPARPDSLRPPLDDAACALVPPRWRGCARAVPPPGRACARRLAPAADAARADEFPSLPVWWPGRFAPTSDAAVSVLARYHCPDRDFWLADLPLRHIPAHVLEAWQALYGVNLSADFLTDQPLMAAGNYGDGRYVLSYSHLETPDSPDANHWLAHLLRELAGLTPQREEVPAWDLDAPAEAAFWPASARGPLRAALGCVRDVLDLAAEHHLFFRRTPWLWGWKAGLPGGTCNNLHTALHTLACLAPSPAALSFWQDCGQRLADLAALFRAGAEGYLLACRLAEALAPTVPDAVDRRGLDNQREAVFGHPMRGGGLIEELLLMVEELIFLSQDEAQPGV